MTAKVMGGWVVGWLGGLVVRLGMMMSPYFVLRISYWVSIAEGDGLSTPLPNILPFFNCHRCVSSSPSPFLPLIILNKLKRPTPLRPKVWGFACEMRPPSWRGPKN